MFDVSFLYDAVAYCLPLQCLEFRFMQRAAIGLLLLSPVTSAMGVQVINFRMAFFSDAISHSAFAGVAIGLIIGCDPYWTMTGLALLMGVAITATARHSNLSSDTATGVFFSAAIAFGLAVVSRERAASQNMQKFLYGDILAITDNGIICLIALLLLVLVFQAWSYNRLLYIGISPTLAQAHRVKVAAYQFCHSALLALIVIVSVQVVGVLLVTAMLIVPAAAARNVSRSAGSMFWWAICIGTSSGIAGLLLSAQPWARTATGATVVLCSFVWFLASLIISRIRKHLLT